MRIGFSKCSRLIGYGLALGIFAATLFGQAAGTINTVAGNGTNGETGDGGQATSAETTAQGVLPDNAGNFYIVEGDRVRKVNAAGVISTYAGGGTSEASSGSSATSAFMSPVSIALDAAGNLYVSEGNLIFKVTPGGAYSIFAGNPQNARTPGDGGPAINAGFYAASMAFDGAGNLYICDSSIFHIRKIDTNGIITTVAGGGTAAASGGGLATNVQLSNPQGLSADSAGNLYFADAELYIRKVDKSGNISTIGGDGVTIDVHENVPALSAGMNPEWTAVDNSGNVYLLDGTGFRIREINSAGVINTVAGSINASALGDGGPATSAQLQLPKGFAVDSVGNIYIADTGDNRIRKVTESAAAPGLPTISTNGVVNGASFVSGVVSNSWATIQGTNLSSITGDWTNAIVNGQFPTKLNGVSVTIGFAPAYIYYTSPTQINLLVPPDLSPGPQPVVVTNAAGSSASFNVTVNTVQPAFFLWPNNQAVATRQDFSIAAANGTFSGSTTVPAKPGDVIILWGTGFGATIPAAPPGIPVPSTVTYSTSTLPTVTIDNVAATVYGAALAPGFAGLYQVAIQVPTSLGNGNWPVVATIANAQSPANVFLTVQQ